MDYSPGGYSWLGVAPESKKELHIEQLEDEIAALSAEYEKTRDEKILNQIESLQNQLIDFETDKQ